MRAALFAASLLLAAPAAAQTLTMAVKQEMFSLDPAFHNGPAGHQIYAHVWQRLTDTDTEGRLVPVLAEGWTNTDRLSWTFRLRRNVVFHDGAAFTAEDVASTFRRIPRANNPPTPMIVYIRSITAVEIVDPHTLILRTSAADPGLPGSLARANITSVRQEAATSAMFDGGEAAIGTGPFRVLRYAKGQVLELARNDRFWGARSAWERVNIRFVANDAARLSGLLAGEVDVINLVPISSVGAVRDNPRVQLVRGPAYRVVHLAINQDEAVPPGTTAADGQPLAANPLRDPRVRQALLLAIDRRALAERVMEGFADPLTQIASAQTFGHDPAR
jgi:peptide/nickel transport system substrate-binding protein